MVMFTTPAPRTGTDARVRLWLLPGFVHVLRAARRASAWLVYGGRVPEG